MTGERPAVLVGPLVGDLGSCYCTWESEAQSYLDFYVSCGISGQFTALQTQMRPSAYALPQCRGLIKHLPFTVTTMCIFSVEATGERLQEEGASLWFVATAWWSAVWVWDCVDESCPSHVASIFSPGGTGSLGLDGQ